MNKVIIFLLEGYSDIQALEYPVSLFLDEIDTEIIPIFLCPPNDKGDITNEVSVDQREIVKKIPSWWDIEGQLRKKGLKMSDVVEIIQIIDIDGVYLDDTKIIYAPVKKIRYYEDKIVCPNRDRIIDRNVHKRHSISRLKTTNNLTINTRCIPYSFYYFCCNIDHFTSGERNLVYKEKVLKASNFAYSFCSGEEFLEFFLSEQNKCYSIVNYKDSWDLLKTNNNSLIYCSNLHLLLIKLKEKYHL